jgi:KDO2-lipid IV(A) lauroyltransferase
MFLTGGPKVQIKDVAICSFIKFCSKFELSRLHTFARLMAKIMTMVPNKSYFVTQRNIQACFPSMQSDEQRALAKESIYQTACTMVEMGPMWLWPSERVTSLVKKVHNEHLLDNAIAEGRGVIILAPHIGNWELLNIYLATKMVMTAMYKPRGLDGLDELIRNARERAGGDTAPANHRGVAKVRKVLKNGGATGILPDQVPDTEGYIMADFFGIPARTMTLLPALANKTGAAVIPSVARRLPNGEGFEIHFLDIDQAIYSEDEQTAVDAMNRAVEACVNVAPAQYQWEYRRFRKTGDTGQNIYQ